MRRFLRGLAATGCLLLVASFAIVLGCSGPAVNCGVCGDGNLPMSGGCPSEDCDDGNSNNADGCDDECHPTPCGDGVTDPGEQCDDDNSHNEDACRNNCTLSECVDDADCANPAKICLHTYCKDGCRTNADCAGAGKACQRNACVPPCTSDASCGVNEVCDVGNGNCVKGCRTDAACQASTKKSNSICDKPLLGTAALTANPCTCASECSGRQVCAGGFCTEFEIYAASGTCRLGCRDDSHCSGGKVCSGSGDCLPACVTNADCCGRDNGNSGDTCVAGKCVDSCTTNADCGNGNICNGSTCVAGCSVDEDCSPGKVCNAPNCVDPPCGVGSKCVFTTSADFAPDFGGALGADSACQAAANAGSNSVRGRTFRAWVSDNTTSPSTRFAHAAVPYKLLDGTTVAENWTDLTDGTLVTPINRNEFGTFRLRSVWTNTTTSGSVENPGADPTTDSCTNWTTAAAGSGRVGFGGELTSAGWTQGTGFGCASVNALYCFQQ